jgi:hypothetical protein
MFVDTVPNLINIRQAQSGLCHFEFYIRYASHAFHVNFMIIVLSFLLCFSSLLGACIPCY